MAKKDTTGTSKVQIPIFGPGTTIPGFTANSKSVWSMFGPLAGEKPVGSIKLDRTDPQDATLLPKNVKRIKIYPSAVNLTKNIMRLSGVNVRGLTHKRLKYQGEKVAEFLNELVLNWKKHSQALMSFRIECTFELTDGECNLSELRAQHKKCQEHLLKGVSANTTMSLIAISDIDSLSRWCLKKFMRLSAGDDKKNFHDGKMATDMLLSLWHSIGYHHLAHSQHMHARFLIDLNTQKVDINTSENQPTKLLKAVLPESDFEWSNETKTSTLLQALIFMKVQKVTTKQKPDTLVFRYMYKKICTATTNGHLCPWCFSSKKMLKKLEDQQETTQATKTACRSNNFETPVELALDVQARLQHHLQSCNPSQNNWDINIIHNVIRSLFFKCTAHDKHNHNQDIIRAIQMKMAIKEYAVADDTQIPAERFEHDEPNDADIDIDDLFRDEFDSFDDAIGSLCEDMQIPCIAMPRDWMTFFEPRNQTFIKLRDCVYASKHFAKGNAKCHFAWNPETQKPMCIKLILNTSKNNHEKDMLDKLMKHTRKKPGQYNIVEYFGHEVRQSSICLKFEIVHPKNNFRKDLTNMTYPEMVTYMRELLKALDYIHNIGITHRDIKPENFVHHFQTNTFRLIDFGSAVYKNQDIQIGLKNAGTRGYKAPELLQPSNSATTKGIHRQPGIDIWSAGIILMSLLTGRKDILSRNDNMETVDCNAKHLEEIGNIVGRKAMKNVNTKNWSIYGDGCKEGEKTGWAAKALQLNKRSWTPSDEALDLLSKMLEVCPRQRITSDAAVKHPWLNPQSLLDDDGADGFDKPANTTTEIGVDTGLPNNANWCYLNSVLQCLKHTKELTSLMIEERNTYQLTVKNKYFHVTNQLRKFLVSDTKAQQIEALKPLQRKLFLLDNKFDGNTQQDAVEVCELLLQGMCDAYATQCPASEVMEYAFKARMKCTNCSATWDSVPEQEFVAKLAVPNNYCLQTAIKQWSTPEILHDVQCLTCRSEGVSKTKELVLAPSVFILQLKIYNNDGTKKEQPVRSNAGSTVKIGTHDYHIFAVVTHAGASSMNGHYMSYAEKNAVWVCFNDDNVTRNKHWQTDAGEQGNETPYIFFLRRIEVSAQAAVSDQIECKQNDGVSKTVNGDGAADEDFLSRSHASVPTEKGSEHGASDVIGSVVLPQLKAKTVFDELGADSGVDAARESNIVALDDTETIYDAQQSGSNTEPKNVLARLEQKAEWQMAILTGCKGDNYDIYFAKTRETRCVTVQNVKTLDWQYWKQEMQSWTCEDFKTSLVDWKIPKDWMKGKGITASDDCQIGTVVAECSDCEDIANLNVGSFNSTNDFNCELVRSHRTDMPCRDQLSDTSEKENAAAFLVTTKNVHKGQQLTWFDVDVCAAMQEGAAQNVSDPKSNPKTECHGAVVEQAHSGSDTDIIPNGINVLVRLTEGENWTSAIVEQRRGSLYDVYSSLMKKTLTINRRNVRTLDWDYWKTEMQSWTYADFKDAVAKWNVQVGAKVYPQMGRGLEALEDCQMGTVVAEYSGYIAYKNDGGLFMGGLYPAMDMCMQQNISVRTMQDEEWKNRKNHCVTLARARGARFCIDGYATTCSMLDNLQDHGGVGWGALLNAANKGNCNCTLLWVAHPDICCVDPTEHLHKDEQVAAFLVTHQNVCKGDQLTWYYNGAIFA
jgi:serine/threonine protein kinase